jgi:hypothetical protein
MSVPEIIVPTSPFPDPVLLAALRDLPAWQVADTIGQADVMQEVAFRAPDGATLLRYVNEPALDIPVVVVDGPDAGALATRLRERVANIPALAACITFDEAATETVKITLLRILCAHAFSAVIPAMTLVAERAAADASPFVRLGAVQLFRYTQTDAIASVLRTRLVDDPDPDVRAEARQMLADYADVDA